MRHALALLLVVGCSCVGEEVSTARSIELASFEASAFSVEGLTIGEAVGADTEASSAIVYTPAELGGLFDPELDELRLEVRATTGTRVLSEGEGTRFSARMPVSGRISALGGTRWELSARCDETVSVPMPAATPDGTFFYADGTVLWQSCLVDLRRGPNLTYGIRVEIHGDGHVEASAMSGAVTVGTAR